MKCPTCEAVLPILKGEIQSCPECGMPVESSNLDELPPEEENESEEEELEEWK